MNDLERAVIEAARALFTTSSELAAKDRLYARVKALDLHEQQAAEAGIDEIEWHEVAAGDEVRGRSGTFYPVLAVQATTGGTWQIKIKMGQGDRIINRPTGTEPRATVRRGPDGTAVQNFVNVFTSGGE